MSYNSDRAASDPDVSDPASGSFFGADFKKHDDLKSMLDSPKDSLKLEAMKRIVTSMASGRDVSDLFAAVVKNVAFKNIEIKKLVYVYLVRYAEEQQDLALLSISTFQKAMKDPNQLIRASALRVLSSIRVHVIAPIMMLAIKEAVMDMSPFVRKTAAHAIPKLYALDPEQKDQLVEVIEKLLKDKTTLVAGSAVMAFEEVCPDRIDLVHKNFRKLCTLLVDIDEWGQVAVIHMLTRYARTQFLDPNKEGLETAEFYPSSGSNDTDSNEDDDDDDETKKKPTKKGYIMDPDHRLLLRTCLPLLLSRNSSVVMGVARLYHHTAPANEMGVITKALVRLLRSHREVQTVVLSNIATMSTTRKGAFEPYLKSFFVHSNDPTHIRLLKLEIMTNIVSETSISTVLREFQTYITSSDKHFVANTIQAIGRCASNISEVTDTCLAGLVRLLSNRDELVVAESVVVIKKLLQLKPKDKSDIISHMGGLVDSIKVPMARASILWLLGEYSDRVPKIAPDILRKMAKSFTAEEDIVKLQILNLGAKLCLSNAKQSKLLFQYVLNVAKYDMNYDIRDRARFLRQLILPAGDKASQITKQAKKLCLAAKPPPVLESIFKAHEDYQLGSLSHMINTAAQGYQALPEWPETQPDPSVRNVEVESTWDTSSSLIKKKSKKTNKNKKSSFYSSSDESDASHSGSEGESGSGSGSGSEEESGSDSGSESKSESDDESGSDSEKEDKSAQSVIDSDIEEIKSGSDSDTASEKSQSTDESDQSEEESEESGSESDSSVEEKTKKTSPVKSKEPTKTKSPEPQSKPSKEHREHKEHKEHKDHKEHKPVQNLDQLLILDDGNSTSISIPAHTPASAILSPSLAQEMESLSIGNPNSPPLVTVSSSFFPSKSYELLHRVTGGGLCAEYKFTRSPCIYSTRMVAVEISLTNTSGSTINNIHVGKKRLIGGVSMEDFQEVASLPNSGSVSVSIGINFNDTTQPANFELCTKDKKYNVSIKAPVGELLYSCMMAEKDFITLQGKLKGMNESSSKVSIPTESCEEKDILAKVSEVANVAQVPCSCDLVYRFAGKTLASDLPVLLTVSIGKDGKDNIITVNCEKMVITSMLLKELKAVLGR